MTTVQLTANSREKLVLDTPAYQVKMFLHHHPKDAEQALSQWLNENDVTIHHVAQSQSEKGGSFVFVITLFYTPNS